MIRDLILPRITVINNGLYFLKQIQILYCRQNDLPDHKATSQNRVYYPITEYIILEH